MPGWLCSIPGERLEYEMNLLLLAQSALFPLLEAPIETVYVERNQDSSIPSMQ